MRTCRWARPLLSGRRWLRQPLRCRPLPRARGARSCWRRWRACPQPWCRCVCWAVHQLLSGAASPTLWALARGRAGVRGRQQAGRGAGCPHGGGHGEEGRGNDAKSVAATWRVHDQCHHCPAAAPPTQHPAQASVAAAAASARLLEDLGRIFLLDILLGNADRLPCAELGWRGNPGNVLLGAQGACVPVCGGQGATQPVQGVLQCRATWGQPGPEPKPRAAQRAVGCTRAAAGSKFAGRVVAIDACVQRRPPAAKLSQEDEAVDRVAQLVRA